MKTFHSSILITLLLTTSPLLAETKILRGCEVVRSPGASFFTKVDPSCEASGPRGDGTGFTPTTPSRPDPEPPNNGGNSGLDNPPDDNGPDTGGDNGGHSHSGDSNGDNSDDKSGDHNGGKSRDHSREGRDRGHKGPRSHR